MMLRENRNLKVVKKKENFLSLMSVHVCDKASGFVIVIKTVVLASG